MKSKKELKDIYKEHKSRIGVFQIRNLINNKIFIEWSSDLQNIWNRHKFQLNSGLHPNIQLQKDWNEYGQDNFSYEILSEIKQEDVETTDFRKEAKQLELMFIEELQPFGDKGYNIKKVV
ncbi:MAG: GIY-YIG nuclease family protein [Saprospiraceae bacterium]|jgi:group I intron endonuclease|nr:GIY-YIG nuclease family protein [Saprospiraceae bacterium]MBL0025787.1 GIY-YIG nuclease family protein [Saprospiraceae bacterium]